MERAKNVNWEWILDNMRYCKQCGNYKVIDNFEGNAAKCKSCKKPYRSGKTVTKPEPGLIHNEADLQANIQKALTGSSKIKIKLVWKEIYQQGVEIT